MRIVLSLLSLMLLSACVGSRQSIAFFDRGAYVASAPGMHSLAESGDPVAQMDLGYLYEHGLGVPQDLMKARIFYEKAAGQDLARADVCLAVLLWEDKQPQDMDRVVELLKRADAAGDQYASYYLAYLYRQGKDVLKDDAEADRYKARAGTAFQDTFTRYVQNMRANIAINQHYPQTAVWGHYGGVVKVDFTIQPPYAKDAKIAESSGHPDLDDAAIAAVYQTYYPSMPPGIAQPSNFTVDINFSR
jgi:TonB family protein